jgi:hypothetical protein
MLCVYIVSVVKLADEDFSSRGSLLLFLLIFLVFLMEVPQISGILDKLEVPFSSIQGSGECSDESSSIKNGRILKKANHLKGWDAKPWAYVSVSGIGLPGCQASHRFSLIMGRVASLGITHMHEGDFVWHTIKIVLG